MIAYHTNYDPYAAQGKVFYCFFFFFFLWTAINHSLLPLFPLTPTPTPHLKAHWKGLVSVVKGQRAKASFLTPTNLSWFYLDSRKYEICFKAKQKQTGCKEAFLASEHPFNVQLLSLLGWVCLRFGPGRDWLLSSLCSYCPCTHFY